MIWVVPFKSILPKNQQQVNNNRSTTTDQQQQINNNRSITTDQQQGKISAHSPNTLLCTHIWDFIIQCITIKMCMHNEEWAVWKYFLVWCNPCLNCRFIFLMNKLYSEATKQTFNNFIRPEGKTGEVENDGFTLRYKKWKITIKL